MEFARTVYRRLVTGGRRFRLLLEAFFTIWHGVLASIGSHWALPVQATGKLISIFLGHGNDKFQHGGSGGNAGGSDGKRSGQAAADQQQQLVAGATAGRVSKAVPAWQANPLAAMRYRRLAAENFQRIVMGEFKSQMSNLKGQ